MQCTWWKIREREVLEALLSNVQQPLELYDNNSMFEVVELELSVAKIV